MTVLLVCGEPLTTHVLAAIEACTERETTVLANQKLSTDFLPQDLSLCLHDVPFYLWGSKTG